MKPILFNQEMVQAILEGSKTVTRRVIKPQPDRFFEVNENPLYLYDVEFNKNIINPQYQVGDIIYVRETWCRADDGYYYKAGFKDTEGLMKAYGYKWHPSIHMPKEIARIFLKVTGLRVERLQDITEEQTQAEGFKSRKEFIETFLKIYPDYTEESWVWVIEFERVEERK